MAGEEVDRRTARTRAAVTAAFVDLLLERGYDQITVSDVVERANVGRSTFYAHYTGLDALLRQVLTNPSAPLAALVDGGMTAEALTPQLSHFHDQRRRNRAFFVEPLRGLWVRALAQIIEPRLEAQQRARRVASPELPLPLVALQIADSHIALIANWLSLRASAPPAAIARALVAVTHAQTQALLGWSPDGPGAS
ncbi:MAG: helix-turn-helix transcriptional regulator [Proteobacteria bacterium]|nr:helix-turn-helix transcriptional regulator [Pseudomonadota bacterium]